MRDPKRIDRVLKKLKIMWTKHPDLRFEQMLFSAIGNLSPTREDDVMENILDVSLAEFCGITPGSIQ